MADGLSWFLFQPVLHLRPHVTTGATSPDGNRGTLRPTPNDPTRVARHWSPQTGVRAALQRRAKRRPGRRSVVDLVVTKRRCSDMF